MDIKLNENSPLAQQIDWDALEVPKKEEESSLTKEIEQDATPTTEAPPKVETEGGEQQPKVETKDEAKVVEQPKTESTQPQVDVEAIRAELEAEIRSSVQREFESKAPKFANETISKLNELALSGIDVDSEDFWKWQSRDLNKYDTSNKEQALELVRLELETENPDLPPTKIHRLLKRKYPALFDENLEPEDDDVKEALEDLEIDAIRTKKKLIEYKDKVTLPKVDLKEKEIAAEQANAAREMLIKDTRKYVNNYKEQPYKLTDDLEIKFQISDEARKFAESSIINNESFFSSNYLEKDKNGNATVNFDRLVRDMTRLAQFDEFVKAAYEQGVSVGKNQTFDELENADESISDKKMEIWKTYEQQLGDIPNNPFRR